MLKKFLTFFPLLAAMAMPVQAQTYQERAYEMGQYVGSYYCHALSNGARTTTDMVRMAIRDGAGYVLDANRLFLEWEQEGLTPLADAYLDGVVDYTNHYCPSQFRRYLQTVQ